MRRAIITIAAVILAAGTVSAVTLGKTIYVDADAAGTNNGTTWPDAYKFLQDALADANSSEKPLEIRVAQGLYQPDRSAAEPNGTGDQHATFQLINGVSLKGGYAGFGQSDPNVQDVSSYETILSGDLTNPFNWDENCFHVVTGSGTDQTAVIDSLTIEAGWAHNGGGMLNENGSPTVQDCIFRYNRASNGAGMYNLGGAPTLTNCEFYGNTAGYGGGMYNGDSDPTLDNCLFCRNDAGMGGGAYNTGGSPMFVNCTLRGNVAEHGGAGMFNDYSLPLLVACHFHDNLGFDSSGAGMTNYSSDTILTNCTFYDNYSDFWGGGMENDDSSPHLTNCIFAGNCGSYGGGMVNADSDPVLTNCKFMGNSGYGGGLYNVKSSPHLANCSFAGNYGAAIFNASSRGASYLTLANCTFRGNYSKDGSALALASEWPDMSGHPGNVEVTNCILWDAGNEIWNTDGSTITIGYSNIRGTWPGGGNIDADPCFADPGRWVDSGDPNITVEPNDPDAVWVDGDYHLKSQGGRWDANEGRWTIDEVTSPCIDAGDPMSPIELEPFPNGGIINMGAYGGTAEASKSHFGEPLCETIVAGDVNGDCEVDFEDFRLMALHWLEAR